MSNSVQSKLPSVDYVSVVRSLYTDRSLMVAGAAAAALGAGIAGFKTGSVLLMLFALAFVVAGTIRHLDFRAFVRANLEDGDVEHAARWERRVTIIASIFALLHGMWCFTSFYAVDDGFAQLSSISITIAALTGMAMRNFGISRLITTQVILIGVPSSAGLIMTGDLYMGFLALLMMPFFVSIRRISSSVREMLLTAVRGRVDASRLAVELDTALSTMSHGLCMLDEEGQVAVINGSDQMGLFGADTKKYIGWHYQEVLDEAVAERRLSEATANYLINEIGSGTSDKLVYGLPDSRQCELTINSRQGRTVLMMEDITERVRDAERINFMARYDGLTQLSNRSYFAEHVEARLKELAALEENDCVFMMIIDIDDFKHVNDTLGHPIGDALLVEVARRLSTVFGPHVMVARFGGDEFTVFRTGNISEERARDDAQAVMAAMNVPFDLPGQILKVNVSIGVVVEHGANNGLDSLLTKADLALYKAKGEGKSRWMLFHGEMDVAYKFRQRLKSDLAQALQRGELQLMFQPIVDLKTQKVSGCEALVRWHHSELGMIPPLDFIPIAEEVGLMSAITRWVLKTAATACASWPGPMTVAVNVSATDFRTDDVEEMVATALSSSGLAPDRLIVEITETAIIDELDRARQALTALRQDGVGVALDDFGTGYSSLSYLHSLPFTKLKIDRTFVVDVVGSKRSQLLLANIARLSKDLDLAVIVEGIETEEQLQVICETADVDFAQGYLFGAPLAATEIGELLALGATLPLKDEMSA